jgi:hypothetical protein
MRQLALSDRLAQPLAQTDSQLSVSLAQRAYQLRDVSSERAATHQLAGKKMAARVAVRVAAAQSPAAQSPAAGPQPPAPTTDAAASGSPQQIAEEMLGSFGWSSGQFSCLDPLWSHESGWSVSAYNPGTGAYGIPQAMPGDKMASAGSDWQTDAATQIRWGLEYIKGTYGSPCGAWDHEEATGWY